MNSSVAHDGPRYASLRDYVRVLRRNWILIAVIAVAFAGAAYAITAQQQATYVAQASVFVSDPTVNLNLLGAVSGLQPAEPDATRAQLAADALGRPPVTTTAAAKLKSSSPAALGASVVGLVNAQTNALDIEATSASPMTAQQAANAFAQALKQFYRNQARAQFTGLANAAQAQFKSLSAVTPDPTARAIYGTRISTLQFLAQTADPVQILQLASVPASPSGPQKVRNALLALLVGLTVALLVAFGRDALDRRLRGTADIAGELEWPILGYVGESAFKAAPFLARNGKADSPAGDRESFRILRENLRFLDVDRPPKSVVVTSALPEEGKSTVAGTLACAFVVAGVQTLLVECDLRRPSLAKRFGLKQAPGLTDFLLGDVAPQEVVQVVDLPSVGSLNGASEKRTVPAEEEEQTGSPTAAPVRRLACITAGRPAPETAELLGSDRFKSFLEQVTEVYEQIILDASPLLSVSDTALLVPETAAALICVRAGRTTRDQATALKYAVDRLPHHLLGVVVTGVRRHTGLDGYYAYRYAYQAKS